MGGRYPPELEYRKTDRLVGFSCPHSHGSVRKGGLEAFQLKMLYVNAGGSSASTELTQENQESFRVGHVHGICDSSPGAVPDCLLLGSGDNYDCLAGLDIDFRWHRPIRISASIADSRKVSPEDT